MSRILSDVDNVQQMVTYALVQLVTSLVTVIGILTWLFIVDWQLALVALPVVPVFVLVSQKMSTKLNVTSRIVQEKTADITGVIQEALSGIEIVKSFSMENIINKTFFKKLKDLARTRVRRSLQSTFMSFSWEATLLPYQAVLFGIGGYWYVTQGTPSIGTLFAFLNYVNILVGPALTLVGIIAQICQAFASFDRIFEYLSYQSEKSGNEILLPQTTKGMVTYDNISFSYDGTTPVLRKVNLNINSGEMVALVGPTGSGKTTLIKLLLRLYDPQEGKITIDDTNIRHINLDSLRRQIAIVSQETFLFNTTIKENLLYVRPEASMEEIMDVCRKTQVHEFIASLPEGYQTVVGERGVKLSGGEKQRISIARAILRNPKIIIMDEPTASLDALTESALWKAVNEYFRGKTTIIIAHRLSTVQAADRIVVLDRGEIVEQGTHQQLLEMKGLYARLYHEQLESQQEDLKIRPAD